MVSLRVYGSVRGHRLASASPTLGIKSTGNLVHAYPTHQSSRLRFCFPVGTSSVSLDVAHGHDVVKLSFSRLEFRDTAQTCVALWLL
jgi:hypothetical protein